jgi:translation elongation factor EF-G
LFFFHALGFVVIFAFFFVHLYLGTIGSPGSAPAMFSGWVTRAWLKKQHPKWLKEMEEVKHFAEVFLRISANGRGKGIEFHSGVPESGLPPGGFLSVEEGIREASTVGVIMGYPLTDLRVTLIKAVVDPDHPSLLALKIAASNASADAFIISS